MMSAGINLVMTVIGFAVSTMFIVFVCTRLICARIQLNASRRSFPIASRSDLNILERGFHGLEPVIAAKFPTKKYCDEFFSSTDDTQCTVCLAEYNSEDNLRILPYCGHYFHVTCIDIWLQQHATCPICRVSLREFPDRRRLMQPMFSSAIRTHYDMLTSHGFSSRTPDNHRPIQEDHCVSEGVGAEAGPVSEDNHISKESVDKHVSPSNL